jgi:hypothetical protein
VVRPCDLKAPPHSLNAFILLSIGIQGSSSSTILASRVPQRCGSSIGSPPGRGSIRGIRACRVGPPVCILHPAPGGHFGILDRPPGPVLACDGLAFMQPQGPHNHCSQGNADTLLDPTIIMRKRFSTPQSSFTRSCHTLHDRLPRHH